jgi:hypothetical protein
METTTERKSLLKKIILLILGFGPGIFAIVISYNGILGILEL